MEGPGQQPNTPPDSVDSSIELVHRAREGDRRALDDLFGRYVPPLRRFAHGRLPGWARGMVDTNDMVQDTLMRTMNAVQTFEPRGRGALLGYMRRALKNRIVDEVRKAQRRPALDEVGSNEVAQGPSPLEETIGVQALELYERALAELSEGDRRAVVARVEYGMDYDTIASELDKPSRDAARMAVSRAIVRLAEGMGHGR